MKRFLSAGLATYIETMKNKFLIKFLSNPRDRSRRSNFHPATEIESSILLKIFHSFLLGPGRDLIGLGLIFSKKLLDIQLNPLLLILQ